MAFKIEIKTLLNYFVKIVCPNNNTFKQTMILRQSLFDPMQWQSYKNSFV